MNMKIEFGERLIWQQSTIHTKEERDQKQRHLLGDYWEIVIVCLCCLNKIVKAEWYGVFTSHSCRDAEAQDSALADSISGESPLPGVQMDIFSL